MPTSRRDFLAAVAGSSLLFSLAGCTSDRDSYKSHTAFNPQWSRGRADHQNSGTTGATELHTHNFSVTDAVTTKGSDSATSPPVTIGSDDGIILGYDDGTVGVHDWGWGSDTIQHDSGVDGLAANDDLLLVTTKDGLFAYETYSYDLEWEIPAEDLLGSHSNPNEGSDAGDSLVIAPGDKHAFVADKNSSQVMRIDLSTGQAEPTPIFEETGFGGVVGPLSITEKILVVPQESGVIGLDYTEREIAWKVERAPEAAAITYFGIAVLPTQDGGLIGIDATKERDYETSVERGDNESGRVLWEIENQEFTGAPARIGHLYVLPLDDQLQAFSPTSGTFVWDIEGDYSTATSLASSQGLGYIGNANGDLEVIDGAMGEIIDTSPLPEGVGTQVVLHEDQISFPVGDVTAVSGLDGVTVPDSASTRGVVMMKGEHTDDSLEGLNQRIVRAYRLLMPEHSAVYWVARAAEGVEGGDTLDDLYPGVDVEGRVDSVFSTYQSGEMSYERARNMMERFGYFLELTDLSLKMVGRAYADPMNLGWDETSARRQVSSTDEDGPEVAADFENRWELGSSRSNYVISPLRDRPSFSHLHAMAAVNSVWEAIQTIGTITTASSIAKGGIKVVGAEPWTKIDYAEYAINAWDSTGTRGAIKEIMEYLNQVYESLVTAGVDSTKNLIRDLPLPEEIETSLVAGIDEFATEAQVVEDTVVFSVQRATDWYEYIIDAVTQYFAHMVGIQAEMPKEERTALAEEIGVDRIGQPADLTSGIPLSDTLGVGYTFSETLSNIMSDETFNQLMEARELPGNHHQATAAAQATYREALEEINEDLNLIYPVRIKLGETLFKKLSGGKELYDKEQTRKDTRQAGAARIVQTLYDFFGHAPVELGSDMKTMLLSKAAILNQQSVMSRKGSERILLGSYEKDRL